jgi:hypothetical protein
MSEENKNPFTIGKPFNIEFDEESTNTITEDDVKEEEQNTTPDPVENVVEEQAPEADNDSEETTQEENKGLEIEDVLDKKVEFDDGSSAEAETQDKQAEEAVQVALSSDDSDFDFNEVATKLIKSGFWEDFEGREDTDIDKETFEQLSKQQDAWKRESLASSLFSNLDPDEKEYLAFKKAGGDLDSYYQSRTVVNRLDNLDLDSKNGKLNSIYTYYKNFVGWDDAKINKHLSRVMRDADDLEEEAQMSYNHIQTAAKQRHQQLLANQQKVSSEKAKAIKSYRKTVRETLKGQNMNNNQIKTVIEGLTKIDDTGFAEIDKAFLQFRNNPQASVLLYRFLTDFDAFMEDAASSRVEQAKKKVFTDIKKSKKVQNEKKDFSFRPTRDRQTKNPFL